jgi:pyochelin biosynthetic protein PchC
VRSLTRVENPAVRLVCFPHSGGTAAAYRAWPASLPGTVELFAVQYPGHADRFAEPPAAGIAEMGARVAEELTGIGPPAGWALFGHSLGALVAYETAAAMPAPVSCLFVSGAAAPWAAFGGDTHRLGDDELWAAVAGLGGVEAEIGDEPELRELLLPVLRADIALHETYRPAPGAAPLRCPVRGYHHTGDVLVDGGRVDAWAAAGDAWCGTRAWPGGHFRPLSEPAELIGDIVTTLAEIGVRR